MDPGNRFAAPAPDVDVGEDFSVDATGEESLESSFVEEEDNADVEEEDDNDAVEEEEEEGEVSDEVVAETEEVIDEVVAETEEGVVLEDLKVVDLKELLKAKGLPVSGRKAELIERIRVNES